MLPRMTKAGLVKSQVKLRPEQWQWLRTLAMDYAASIDSVVPDPSAVLRGILDEYKKSKERPPKKAKAR